MRTFLVIGGIFLCLATTCLSFPQESMKPYHQFEGEDFDSDEHGQSGGNKQTNCSCGWTNKARIVGGKETLKNEYPLIAGITLKGERAIFCGGSIITPRHILTAAHCPHEFPGEALSVVVGEHDQTKDTKSSGAQIIDVKEAIEHEQYDEDTFFNDIAMLVLERQIVFNQLIGPVCLPSSKINLVHEYIKAIGWGKISTYGPTSNVLMKVNLRVIPLQSCVDNYIREIRTENPHQICTYLKSKDSCQGDSGGPLIWLDPDTNRYTLIALVSYGKKCGQKSPAINTDVYYFMDWIQRKIAETDKSVNTCAKV